MIELIVVMAIIALLVALLLSGIQAAMRAQGRAETLFEIGKFDEALKGAMQKYGNSQSLPGRLPQSSFF